MNYEDVVETKKSYTCVISYEFNKFINNMKIKDIIGLTFKYNQKTIP